MTVSFRTILGATPSTPSTSDSVLIVIDAQNEYMNGKLAIKNLPHSLHKIAGLLQTYRSAGGDIIHVVHNTPDGAPVFTPNTELSQIMDIVKPVSNEIVINKTAPSAFTKTDLVSHLQKLGKNRLVLVGYMAHVCVSSTTRSATEHGYDVTVVKDAIGDRDIPGATAEVLVETVCAELGDTFATILSAKDIQ